MKVANFIAVGPLKKGSKLFSSEQESPGAGGGGYSPIKMKGALVGKFGEHP